MNRFLSGLGLIVCSLVLAPAACAQRQLEVDGGSQHVAFSPCGQVFALAGPDIKLHNLRGRVIATIKGRDFDFHVAPVAFSPVGKVLAAGGEKGVLLWNTENPESPKPVPFPKHKEPVNAVAFSADGTLLAWRSKSSIIVWNRKSEKAVATIDVVDNYLREGIAFSPDGTMLAWANPDVIVLWGLKEGKPVCTIKAKAIAAPAFHPKKYLLCWNEPDKLVFWDTKTQKVVDHLDLNGLAGGGSSVCGPVFTNDGKRLVAVGGTAKGKGLQPCYTMVLDFASGLHTTKVRMDARAAAFSPNGEYLVLVHWNGVEQHYVGPAR